MSTCPSAASAMTTCSRTSSRTSTARATLAAIRRPRAAAASRSAGAARSRGSSGSMTRVVLLPPHQVADRVQQTRGHLRLGGPRDPPLRVGGDHGHLVGGRVEADVETGDVVEDHGVEALVAQLAAGVLE